MNSNSISLNHVNRDIFQLPSTEVTKGKRKISFIKSKASQALQSVVKTTMEENVKTAEKINNPKPVLDTHELSTSLKVETKLLVGKEEGVDPGKHITYRFEHKGVVYGQENVERMDSVQNLSDTLNNQLKLLKERKNDFINTSAPQDVIDSIDNHIKLAEKSLANVKNMSKDPFIKSSFYRDELKIIIDSGKNYQTAINDICLGAAVNLRYQSCTTATNRETGFFRLGVITDLRNGLTHLGEMREFLEDPIKLQAKIKELQTQFNKLKANPKTSNAILSAYQYALAQLEPSNLRGTISERQHILSNQMQQLVHAQVDKNFEKIANSSSDEFNITHVALLNRKTNTVDPSGWVHDEANEMADMNEIFKDFAGKKLIFDGKGPCVDEEGNIHMAKVLTGPDGTREITLKTNFVNVSVQGHNKNDGIQKIINDSNMAKIIDVAKHKFASDINNPQYKEGLQMLLDIEKKLKQGKSDYQLAEDLCSALLKMGMYMTMGCLSAKDRTGYVGARAILRVIREYMAKLPEFKNNPKLLEKIYHGFEKKILDEDAAASRIVKDNTPDVRVLKLSANRLPGYNNQLINKRRLVYYARQLKVSLDANS